MSHWHGQTQPIRPGDVYPASGEQEARHGRDTIVDRGDVLSPHDGSLAVTETDLPGKRVATATACGQVVAQFTVPVPDTAVAEASDAVTIGEALEAAGLTSAGDKPVSLADAAALQTAEMRATGLAGVVPGGVTAAAQKAAETNMNPKAGEGERVRLKDVVCNAAAVLPANKVATREDAKKVAAAAGRNVRKDEEKEEGEEGVAAAVTAAARLNEERML